MQCLLQVVSGPFTGRRIEVPAGSTVRLGRTNKSDHAFPGDTFMSGRHCEVECQADRCVVRDLGSSNGTWVNGIRVPQALLRECDRLGLGQTVFAVSFPAAEAGAGAAPGAAAGASGAGGASGVPEPRKRLIQFLSSQPEPLFAVLDAAQDPMVLGNVRAFGDLHQSLYEGKQAQELADFAPYLVQVPANSQILEKAAEAWGSNWGIFLTCGLSFDEVRAHLRQFLEVKTEDGRELMFRFYDPRILRAFLPACTPEETTALFGPVRSFLTEAEEPDSLLKFTPGPKGAVKEAISLAPPKKS